VTALEKRLGELRPTQLIQSFGVGAMIDLPHFSVMLLGLEDWPVAYSNPIVEERLLRAVQARLGPQVERLVGPPIQPRDLFSASEEHIGIPVATFPRYLRCPYCSLLAPLNRFTLVTRPGRPDKAHYIHRNCNKANEPAVVPARFLVACQHGHIDDFPWHEFVHGPNSRCPSDLRLKDLGGTEATEVLVSCVSCGAPPKSMAEAFSRAANLPACRARRPHLRDFAAKGCREQSEAILLGASNSWFAVSLSALHIPHAAHNELAQRIEEYWSTLQRATTRDVVEYLLGGGEVPRLASFSVDAIWAAIEARRAGAVQEEPADLKVPEWEAFTRIDPNQQTTDFELEEVPPPPAFASAIGRVILVRRVREVTALIGFTRIESPRDSSAFGDVPGVKRMVLSRGPAQFAPASEVRGEGIFLQFDDSALSGWCAEQHAAEEGFFRAHKAWRKRRKIEPPEAGFPGFQFVVLHSFAHALMRQLSLECGYSAASLRERIYCNTDEALGPRMAGVLIYTAAPDSEGTLGGLVRMGRPNELDRHVRRALHDMRLCSSDPLCADHLPDRDGVTLHGAACHACLFAPETSCERGNKYLSRGAIVSTVRGTVGFFDRAQPK
jgi:hypothetical protein